MAFNSWKGIAADISESDPVAMLSLRTDLKTSK